MAMIETKKLKIADLALNEGQVPGLPTNPRQWTREDLDKLKASIKETPELFEARGILVYPFEGKYVVLGGNMRLSAAKELKMKDVPCIILPEETPVEKLKELVIKDNGAFGAWDYDLLGNEWDDLPLPDWGVPAQMTAEEEAKKLEKGEIEGDVPFAEQLGEEHNYICLYFDNEVDWLQAQTLFDIKAVQCPSTKKDGKGFMKFGVGRVINGAEAIQKLLNR